MAYPILAEKNTWWAPTVSTVKKANITEIEIKDSYTPDASVTVVDSWDASAAKDGSITCYVIGTKLIIAGNGSGKIAANEDSSYCFSGSGNTNQFSSVTAFSGMDLFDTSDVIDMTLMFSGQGSSSIDLSNWGVQKVKSMQGMFIKNSNLSSVIGLENWNTSSLNNISYMFGNSHKLVSCDLSNFNVSNVTDMNSMFAKCYALTSIGNLAEWDVSNVTILTNMFFHCNNLITLNLSNWDVSSVTSMFNLFANCISLTSVGDLSNWNVSNVTGEGFGASFNNCQALTSIGDLSNWNVSNSTSFYGMFYQCKSLTSLNLSNWDTSNVTNMGGMFNNCSNLTSVEGISNWDVSNVTIFDGMFVGCRSLITLDLSNWDVSNAINMGAMFSSGENYGGGTFTEINVSNWNPCNCTNMSYMFYGQTQLKTLDVSKWDVSKVTNFHHMFCWCTQLVPIGVENWNTESAVYLNGLFHGNKHTSLDLSGWDVSKVQTFAQMFENNSNLIEIKGLNKWNTSAGKGFDEMFVNCPKLTELDLSSFDTRNASANWTDPINSQKGSMSRMFEGMNNLKKITFGENFSFKGDGSCAAAVLPTPSTDYIEGADGNWYTLIGESYAPAAIKDKTAETYYASYDIVANVDVICKNGSLLDAAKAIREKNGSTERYTPAQFGAAIRALN